MAEKAKSDDCGRRRLINNTGKRWSTLKGGQSVVDSMARAMVDREFDERQYSQPWIGQSGARLAVCKAVSLTVDQCGRDGRPWSSKKLQK